MNKLKQKQYSEAYDKLYDLNSTLNYALDNFLTALKSRAKQEGYEFKLNSKDKWKCVRAK